MCEILLHLASYMVCFCNLSIIIPTLLEILKLLSYRYSQQIAIYIMTDRLFPVHALRSTEDKVFCLECTFEFKVPSYAENSDLIQYPFTRKVVPDTIQDIQDGSNYRKLMKPEEFLSVPEHTGLILCSDGVPVA